MDLITIPADHRHVGFILETWMKSMRLSPEFDCMDDDEYYTWAKGHIAEYIANSDCLASVDAQHPDIIAGYVVYDGPILHWAYVIKGLRKQNVFKDLRPAGLSAYSHRSPRWDHQRSGLLARPWFCRADGI